MRCVERAKELEECACCGSEACPTPVCYPDMAVELGESAPVLHEHGG